MSASNVIQFSSRCKASADYAEKLVEFEGELEEMSSKLFSSALGLAVLGKWQKWNESMPVGSEFHFDEGMLLETGDDFVTQAINIRLQMMDLAEKIRLRNDQNLIGK